MTTTVKNIKVRNTSYPVQDTKATPFLSSTDEAMLLSNGTYRGEEVSNNTIFSTTDGVLKKFTKTIVDKHWITGTAQTRISNTSLQHRTPVSAQKDNVVITAPLYGSCKRSTDGGATWANFNIRSVSASGSGTIVYWPKTSKFYGNAQGLFSTDGSSAWSGPLDQTDTYSANPVYANSNVMIAYDRYWIDESTPVKYETSWQTLGYDSVADKFYAQLWSNGDFYESSDGVNWTLKGKPGQYFNFIAAYNGTIVGFRRNGSSNTKRYVSTDGGATWASEAFADQEWFGGVYQGLFYMYRTGAVADFIISTDGLTWTQMNRPDTAAAQALVRVDDKIYMGNYAYYFTTGIDYDYALTPLSYTASEVDTALASKQGILTAGNGITLTNNTVTNTLATDEGKLNPNAFTELAEFEELKANVYKIPAVPRVDGSTTNQSKQWLDFPVYPNLYYKSAAQEQFVPIDEDFAQTLVIRGSDDIEIRLPFDITRKGLDKEYNSFRYSLYFKLQREAEASDGVIMCADYPNGDKFFKLYIEDSKIKAIFGNEKEWDDTTIVVSEEDYLDDTIYNGFIEINIQPDSQIAEGSTNTFSLMMSDIENQENSISLDAEGFTHPDTYRLYFSRNLEDGSSWWGGNIPMDGLHFTNSEYSIIWSCLTIADIKKAASTSLSNLDSIGQAVLDAKQNTLIAGTGITIDSNNVISATGGSGDVSLTNIATAGTGISFTNVSDHVASTDKIGSVVFSDGKFTPSSSNYLQLTSNSISGYSGSLFTENYNWSWTVKFKSPADLTKMYRIFTMGSATDNYNIWCSITEGTDPAGFVHLGVHTSNGWINVAHTPMSSDTSIQPSTWYWVRISRDVAQNQYKLELSTDGTNWNVEAVTSSSYALYNTNSNFYISQVTSSYLPLEYDLSGCSFTSNYGTGIDWVAYAPMKQINNTGLINTATGTDCLTILGTPSTGTQGTNIGLYSAANSYATSLGRNARAHGGASTALGRATLANKNNAVAIGVSAQATANGAIALGAQARNDEAKTFKVALTEANDAIPAVDESTGLFTLLQSDGTIPQERLGEIIILGENDPTENTEGTLGLLYKNTLTGELFRCSAIEEDASIKLYTWVKLIDASNTYSKAEIDAMIGNIEARLAQV